MAAADFWAAAIGMAVYFGLAIRCSTPARLSSFMFGALIVQYLLVILPQNYTYENPMIYNIVLGQLMAWGCGMIWITHIACPAGFRFTRTPLTRFAGVYMILTLLAALYAPTRVWYSVLEVMMRFAAAALTYFAVAQFASTRRRWDLILRTLLGVAFICWLYGLMQYGGHDPFYKGDERTVFSFFGNKSFYGSWLAYIVPLSLYVSQTFSAPWRYIAFGFAATLGVFNLYLADTRSSWLAFGLFLILVPAFELWRGRFAGRLRDAAFGLKLCAGALAVIAAAWLLAPEHLKARLGTVAQAKTGTNVVRLFMWEGAVQMMLDRPLFGQGTGTFEQVFLNFRDDKFHRKGIQYGSRQAHSEPMEIMAEQGIIGFAAWLALIFAFVYYGVGRLRREPDLRERVLFFGLLAAVCVGLINDFIQPTMRILNHAMTFWILLGLISRYLAGFEPEEEKRRLRPAAAPGTTPARLALCAATAVVFGFLSVIHLRWLKSEKLYYEANWTKVHSRYNELTGRLLELNPYFLPALLGRTHINPDYTISPVGEDAARRLTALSPNHVPAHRNAFSGLMGRYEKDRNPEIFYFALEHLAWAAAADNSIDFHLPLAHFFLERGMAQRSLYHARFIDREISDEYAEEILRHPSRIGMKPGESDAIFDSREGKGEFGNFPTRFTLGMQDYFLLRGRAQEMQGVSATQDLYLYFQAARRLPDDPLWLERALRRAAGSNLGQAHLISLLESSAAKSRVWSARDQAELQRLAMETQTYLAQHPDDSSRTYLFGLALLNLAHPDAPRILESVNRGRKLSY